MCLIAATLAGASPVPLQAQRATSSLREGARLRITAPCEASPSTPCTFVGRVVALRAGTVQLDVDGVATDLVLARATRVETSAGLHSHRLVGAAAGFTLGTGAVYLAYSGGGLCDREANQDAIGHGPCLVVGALVGGIPAAALGTLIGHLIRTERWSEMPMENLRVSLAPTGRGGVGIELSF
jgi:hypothetical protein